MRKLNATFATTLTALVLMSASAVAQTSAGTEMKAELPSWPVIVTPQAKSQDNAKASHAPDSAAATPAATSTPKIIQPTETATTSPTTATEPKIIQPTEPAGVKPQQVQADAASTQAADNTATDTQGRLQPTQATPPQPTTVLPTPAPETAQPAQATPEAAVTPTAPPVVAPQAAPQATPQAPAVAPAASPAPTPSATPAAAPTPATPQPAATPPAAATPAPAVIALPPDVNATITNVVGTMETAEKTLSDITTVNSDLGRLRDDIDKVISNTTRTADSLRPRLADIKRQIDKLGPVPAPGEPVEAASAATERARLGAEAAQLSGAIKTLEVTWWRARQAIDKITDLRLKMFVRSLTERMSSPLFSDVWSDVTRDIPSIAWRWQYNVDDWSKSIKRQSGNVLALLAAAFALFVVLKALISWAVRYRPQAIKTEPSFFERAASVSWIAPARAVPGIATALALYGGFEYLGLLYYPTAAPAGAALLRASLIFIGVSALLTAVFAPGQPERRLLQLSNRSAWRICRLLQVMTLIYSLDLFFTAIGQILYVPLSISVVQSLITSLLFAAVLVGLLLTPFEPFVGGVRQSVGIMHPRSIKIPLWLATITIVGVCLAGYVALGRFLAQQILITGIIGLVGVLLFLAIRAFTRETSDRSPISYFMEQQLGLDEARRRQIGWLIETTLTILLGLILLPLLLLQWGFAAADIEDWFKALIFGFDVGSVRISLARIVLGIGLFIALLFVTRVVQRRLRENVLNQPRMDPGIANSVDTAVGYAGIALAAIIAVSYAGFDITSLAIVAGALSVGIGFGLQSIVNNFVSGLILLIERPIKVGDWIVVGDQEGIVKRISVRSTEIETFDRASLMVPNSELITGRVLNWTHRNAMGRIVVRVNAGTEAEPNKIIAILNRVAEKHPDVLNQPAPISVFEGYSATETEYSLRCFVPDVNRSLGIKSQLRIAVYEAFRAENIDMPVTNAIRGGGLLPAGID